MSAEEHLNKLDIWNHPRITDRNEKESYDVAEIMESYAREYHAKEMKKNLIEVEKEIEAREKVKHKDGYDNGFIDGLQWLLNHLKQSNKE